jgi:hypothetical protein
MERHPDLPTEPDLDPCRTGRAWTVLASSEVGRHSFVRRAKDAQNRRPGAQARLHMIEHARRVRLRCGRPVRFGGPGMQPIPRIVPGGTQRAFPFLPQRPAIDTRSAAGRQSSLGFDCLQGDTQKTQPIRSAGCQTSGDEKRWSPAPSSTVITTERSGRAFGTRSGLGSYHRLDQPVAFEDHGECWTDHGECPSLSPGWLL